MEWPLTGFRGSGRHRTLPVHGYRGRFWWFWCSSDWKSHSTLSIPSLTVQSSPRPFFRMTSSGSDSLYGLCLLPPRTSYRFPLTSSWRTGVISVWCSIGSWRWTGCCRFLSTYLWFVWPSPLTLDGWVSSDTSWSSSRWFPDILSRWYRSSVWIGCPRFLTQLSSPLW